MLGNPQAGQPDGKCNRKQTADGRPYRPAQARVKRWGKSPPARRVTGRLANPIRSKVKQGHRWPADQVPGRPLEAAGDRRRRGMVASKSTDFEQNPAYRRARTPNPL